MSADKKTTAAAPAQSQHQEPKAQAPAKGKAQAHLPEACHAQGCKAKSKRFDFCEEHYDHFKFGLIKKTGEQVSDYEKKFEHYVAYTKKRDARKVA